MLTFPTTSLAPWLGSFIPGPVLWNSLLVNHVLLFPCPFHISTHSLLKALCALSIPVPYPHLQAVPWPCPSCFWLSQKPSSTAARCPPQPGFNLTVGITLPKGRQTKSSCFNSLSVPDLEGNNFLFGFCSPKSPFLYITPPLLPDPLETHYTILCSEVLPEPRTEYKDNQSLWS